MTQQQLTGDALDNAPPDPVSQRVPPSVAYAGNSDALDNAPPDPVYPAEVSKTGLTTEPVAGWGKALENLSAHFALGAGGIAKSVAGLGLAAGGSFDDAQQMVETHSLMQAQSDSQDYGNSQGFDLISKQFGGFVAEQLPQMGLGGVVMATGAGVAAIAGAPLAAGVGIGAALFAGTMAIGNHMYNDMQRGTDVNTSRVGALGAGVANAAIAYITGGVLARNVEGATAAALASPSIKAALLNTAKRLAVSAGVQFTGGELSAFVDGVTTYIVTRTSHDAKPYTGKEAMDDFGKATATNFGTAVTFGAGGEALGLGIGRVFKNHVDRAQALQAYLDRVNANVIAKNQQQLANHAAMVMGLNIPHTVKITALQGLVSATERANLVEQAVAAVKIKQGANPLKPGDVEIKDNPLESKEHLQGFLQKTAARISPWSRTFGQPFVTLEGQLAIAFQDIPEFQALSEKFGTSKAVEMALTLRREYSDMYYGHLSKVTGLKPAKVQDLEFKALKVELSIDHVDATGKHATLELTAGQALQYLLWTENDDARVALLEPFHLAKDGTKIGNGFSLDTVRALRDALYDADPNYLKAFHGLKAFYDDIGPMLKHDFEAIYPGETLDLQYNYGGSIYRDGVEEVTMPEDTLKPLVPGGEIKNPRFTNERGPSKIFIEKRDAFQNAANRVRQQAQWRAMAEAAPLWHDLVNNKQFKHALETKFPRLFQAIKQNYIDTINGVPAAQKHFSKWLSTVMKARAFSKLAAKPLQMGKHMWTLGNFFSFYEFRGKPIPPDAFTSGVLDAHLHWKQAITQIFSWDEVKNRYATPENIVAQLNADSMSPGEVRTQRFFMKPFEVGDKYALVVGTHAVYEYVLEQTGDAALAKTEAVKAFKNVLASGAMDQQSSLSRSPLGKAAMQFKQPETRLAQHVLERWRKYANFRTPENLQYAMRAHILSALAAAFFILPETVVATGTALATGSPQAGKNEGELWFRFVQRLELGNMFPLIEDAMTTANTIVTNAATGSNHPVYDFTVAPAASLESIAKATKDSIEWIEGKGSLHLVYKTALDAIGAANLAGIGAPEAPVRGVDWLSQILGFE